MASERQTAEPLNGTPRAAGFFAARWLGLVPLARLFWIDALLVATGINLAFGAASLTLLANGWPLWSVLGVYALPIPYNLFLTAAIWRQAEREASGLTALAWQWGAILWLVVASLL